MPGELRADARRNRVRILEVAEAVFAEQGASAATEEVARRAGVAIGTVFRHFPTKHDLLVAVVKNVLDRLVDEVRGLVDGADPADGLVATFARVVQLAAANKAVFDRLAETGAVVDVGLAVARLRPEVDALLDRARRAGALRAEVGTDEVMALLAAAGQGALTGGWDGELQRRTLAVVVAGLRPPPPGSP
jgi:AcrR family transcriptional regulator